MSETLSPSSAHRRLIDLTFNRLYNEKHRVFAAIMAMGRGGPAVDTEAELTAVRAKFTKYNQWLIAKMDSDPEFAASVWLKCADGLEGMLFWIDSFGWTFNPQLAEPHLKMVLYPFQEDLCWMRYWHIMEQKSMGEEKSRMVGASWVNMFTDAWLWLFEENGNVLVGSYKEEYVDGKSDKALLPKFDYILERQPVQLLPEGYKNGPPHRIFKLIKNPCTKSIVEGEATNPNFGRGGRKRAVDCDEWAHWGHDTEAKRSMSKNARCILYTSTPNGLGNEFAKQFYDGTMDKIKMHLSRHPEYQEGVYECQPGCKFHPEGGKWHSARYDRDCAEYDGNPQAVAQELDINYLGSGGVSVFKTDVAMKCISHLKKNKPDIQQVKLELVKPDSVVLSGADLRAWFKQAKRWRVSELPDARGSMLRVWQRPFSCRDPKCACGGSGKHVYVMGSDAAKGLPHGDNTVFCILDVTACRIVAEWCGKLEPMEAGIEGAKLAKWYGTSMGALRDAFCAPEWNAEGLTIGHVLINMGLPVFISKSDDKTRRNREDKIGVVIQPHNRSRLLKEYLGPYLNRTGTNGLPILYDPFIEFWEEVTTYVSFATTEGEINPDKAKSGAQRGKHDDRIFARLAAVYAGTMQFNRIYGVIRKDELERRSSGLLTA